MKVLFVDDNKSQLESYEVRSQRHFPAGTEYFFADTLARAGALFRDHDFDAIVLDGCVPGDKLNVIPFINMVTQKSYKGILVAASGSAEYREQMMKAGCTHEVTDKGQAVRLVYRILFN